MFGYEFRISRLRDLPTDQGAAQPGWAVAPHCNKALPVESLTPRFGKSASICGRGMQPPAMAFARVVAVESVKAASPGNIL